MTDPQLNLSDDLNWENLGVEDELTIAVSTTMENEVHGEYIQPQHETAATILAATSSIYSSTAATVTNVTATGENSAMKTPKSSNNQTSKRMLTISGTTSSQKKKKVDPFANMSQLNGTLQNLASSDKEEKMRLLESKYKSEELKLCCREIDIMERKSIF